MADENRNEHLPRSAAFGMVPPYGPQGNAGDDAIGVCRLCLKFLSYVIIREGRGNVMPVLSSVRTLRLKNSLPEFFLPTLSLPARLPVLQSGAAVL